MMAFLALVLCLGGACTYQTLEEACPNRLWGSRGLSEDAEFVLGKVNCYRRMAGVKPSRADTRFTEALQSHVDYLDIHHPDDNDLVAEGNPDAETPGEEGFTGVDVYARIAHTGKFLDRQFTVVLQLMLLYYEEDFTSLQAWVDQKFAAPYSRQFLLQPGYREGGYARAGNWGNQLMSLPYPDVTDVGKPRHYPGAGQIDVPPNYVHALHVNLDSDPIPAHEDIGYPITITVTDYYVPYDVTLGEASLTGPDGEVDIVAFGPAEAPDLLLQTLVIVPLSPLEEYATYAVSAQVSNSENTFDLEWEFTTGEWNEFLTQLDYVYH
jgi:hypothetical protein